VPEETKVKLENTLAELSQTGDIEASAIVRRDGLMIASDLPSKVDGRTIAAMAAALVGTAETTSGELARGSFKQVVVESQLGKIVSVGAGKLAVIVCLVKKNGNLGLVLLTMARVAKKVEDVLE